MANVGHAWKAIVLWAALLLVNCSGPTEAVAKLCQANIKAGLINPETAQFFEFQPISAEQAEESYYQGALKMRGTNSGEVVSKYGAETDAAFRDVAQNVIGGIAAEGAEFYTYRVKAHSRVGLTVTTNYTCASGPEQCACFDEDDLGSGVPNGG